MKYKTGIVCGTFDLVHPGHIALFEQCKNHCEYLIAGLQTDPSGDRVFKNKPVMTTFERTMILGGCKHIDHIICYDVEADIVDMYAMLDINVVFVGDDHSKEKITGGDILEKRSIPVIFIPRLHSFSTTSFRNRIITGTGKPQHK